MPGGHLVTSVALSGAAYSLTGSVPAAAGCFFGGFLIDADHYFDYLFIERQWRRPMPQDFLRYYFESRAERVVLPLHSWELMGALTVVALTWQAPLVAAYVVGALMHLFFDIVINGEYGLKSPVKFYSFFYRQSQAFLARNLARPPARRPDASLASQFWSVRSAAHAPEPARTDPGTADSA